MSKAPSRRVRSLAEEAAYDEGVANGTQAILKTITDMIGDPEIADMTGPDTARHIALVLLVCTDDFVKTAAKARAKADAAARGRQP